MDAARTKKQPGDGKHAVEEVKRAIEKRLFLGRLPCDVSESELRGVFEQFGEITECRIINEKVPGKTVAFVGFATWAAAHAALKATDGQVSLQDHKEDQKLVASFAERTSTVGRGGGAHYAKGHTNSRIFVGGLPETVNEDGLREIFEPFGNVEAVSLLAAKTSRRCGFVNFSLWGEAIDAISVMDNEPLQSSELGVTEDVLTVVLADPKAGKGEGKSDANAYEGSALKRRQVDAFGHSHAGAQQGEFEKIKNQYLAAAEGNASEEVCTTLHWALMSARSAWNQPWSGHAGGGRQPSHPSWSGGNGGSTSSARQPISSAEHRGHGSGDPREDREAARLFVGGLPYEVTDEDLRQLILQLQLRGRPSETELLECRVLPGKGCGYIRFASWSAAEQAMEALDDRTVAGWKLPLRAKWATVKGAGGGGGASSDWGGPIGGSHTSSRDNSYGNSRGGSSQGSSRRQRSRSPRGEARGRQSSGVPGAIDRHRLFIGQLQRGAQRQDVTAAFEPYGDVEDVKYLEDKGVAYVTYREESAAKRACEALNGQDFPGISRGAGGLNVQFAKVR